MTAVVAAPSTVAQLDYAVFVDNGIVVVDPVAVLVSNCWTEKMWGFC